MLRRTQGREEIFLWLDFYRCVALLVEIDYLIVWILMISISEMGRMTFSSKSAVELIHHKFDQLAQNSHHSSKILTNILRMLVGNFGYSSLNFKIKRASFNVLLILEFSSVTHLYSQIFYNIVMPNLAGDAIKSGKKTWCIKPQVKKFLACGSMYHGFFLVMNCAVSRNNVFLETRNNVHYSKSRPVVFCHSISWNNVFSKITLLF